MDGFHEERSLRFLALLRGFFLLRYPMLWRTFRNHSSGTLKALPSARMKFNVL